MSSLQASVKIPVTLNVIKNKYTSASESGVSDSSCCQQAVENCEVLVHAKWTQLVRSEWPVAPLQPIRVTNCLSATDC